MVEVRLTRRMRQRPIGFLTSAFLDYGGKTDPPRPAGREFGQAAQIDRGAELECIAVQLRLDARCRDLGLAHSTAMALEAVTCPFARGCEVELVVALAGPRSNEDLEARMLPKPIRAPRRSKCGQEQLARGAGHQVAQFEGFRSWPCELHLDARCRLAIEVRMKLERQSHFAPYAIFARAGNPVVGVLSYTSGRDARHNLARGAFRED